MTATNIPATTSPRVLTGSVSGPNPYAAGGFDVDLSATFATISFFALSITTIGPNLPPVHYEYALDTPAVGKVRVKIMRHRYDKVDAGNSATSQPGGVTLATSSGQNVVSEAAHTHTQSALTAQAVDAVGGAGNATRVSVATGAGTSHTHAMNTLYQHTHAATQTDAASVELGAVDLSGSTWRWLAVGA